MPNRIIKESICTSDSIDKLTPEEEVFCYRLIVNADDYGRFHADPVLLRSMLFPRRTEKIKLQDIGKWLISLSTNAKMIILYTNNGKNYLQFLNWGKHQQIRAAKSKFPAHDDEGSQLISVDSNGNQPESNVPVIVFDIRNRNRNRDTDTDKSKTKYLDTVYLTDKEYEKLIADYGEPSVKRMIEILDTYKDGNGKTYKNDNKVMRGWVLDRYKQEQSRGAANGVRVSEGVQGEIQNDSASKYAGFFSRSD